MDGDRSFHNDGALDDDWLLDDCRSSSSGGPISVVVMMVDVLLKTCSSRST